jgi:hypothetical protein
VLLIAAPPDTFALITRGISEDRPTQEWVLETVVAFDADDGGAYVVGGLNRSGVPVRLDDVAASNGFTLAGIWEQDKGGKDAARKWAKRHIKLLYEDAIPLDPDDPRRSG